MENAPLKAVGFNFTVFFKSEDEQGFAQAIFRSAVEFRRQAQDMHDLHWLRGSKKVTDDSFGETVGTQLQQFAVLSMFKNRSFRVIADKLDVQKKGALRLDELKDGLRKQGHDIPSDSDACVLMDAADVDGNGTLDLGELMAVSINIQKIENAQLLCNAFAFLHRNDSGLIGFEELCDALVNDLGPDHEEILNSIVRDFETEKGGKNMMKTGTDWRKASMQYSRERFNTLSW